MTVATEFDIEDFMRQEHAKQYKGLDDEMGDDYQEWLSKIPLDELVKLINKFIGK